MSMYNDEADHEWRQARRHHLLDRVRRARPRRLQHPGELHPKIADWVTRFVAAHDPSNPNPAPVSNLMLGGPVGTTKTWNVWEALERAVTSGFDGSWMFAASADWQDIVAPPVDRDRLQTMRTVDLLVLDDFGSGRMNEWQRECLLSVVDERWAHARPIIVTFNAESLREMVGERIASRLAHDVTSVLLDGDDRRRTP